MAVVSPVDHRPTELLGIASDVLHSIIEDASMEGCFRKTCHLFDGFLSPRERRLLMVLLIRESIRGSHFSFRSATLSLLRSVTDQARLTIPMNVYASLD